MDDGSTDESWEVISAFNHVKAKRTENRGVSSARNVGLEMATGTYVRFVDSDDTVPIGSSEKLLAVATQDRAAVGRADDANYGFTTIDGGDFIPTEMLFCSTLPVGLTMFPKAALVRIGGFDEQLMIGEDQELSIRLAKNGLLFRQIDEEVYRVGHRAEHRLTRGADSIVFDRLFLTVERLIQLAATENERLMVGRNAWGLAREASRRGCRKQAVALFSVAIKAGGERAVIAPSPLRLLYTLMSPYRAERILAATKRIAGR